MQRQEIINLILQLCAYERTDVFDNLSLSAVDVDSIVAVASQQGVAAWMLQRIKEDYSDVESLKLLMPQLKKVAFNTFAKNSVNKAIFVKMRDALAAEGIQLAGLKGIALMLAYYPEMSLRPIGDIDVWVEHKDAYRAYEILRNLEGAYFKRRFRTDFLQETIRTHLNPIILDGMMIELHFQLFSVDFFANPNVPIGEKMVAQNCEGEEILVPDNALMLYHLSTHAIKNQTSHGMRIGWLVDIALILKSLGEQALPVCRETLSLNQKVQRGVLDIWQYVFSMLPAEQKVLLSSELCIEPKEIDEQFLSGVGSNLKFGTAARFRTIKVVFCGFIRFICQTKGFKQKIQMAKDIAYDMINRKK